MKTEYPDILNKVIYCISQNKSIGEICSILNINCDDLLKILKLLKKNNYEIDNYHFADDLILDIDSTSLKSPLINVQIPIVSLLVLYQILILAITKIVLLQSMLHIMNF